MPGKFTGSTGKVPASWSAAIPLPTNITASRTSRAEVAPKKAREGDGYCLERVAAEPDERHSSSQQATKQGGIRWGSLRPQRLIEEYCLERLAIHCQE